mgnify:CR=1 FL=1
MAAGGPTRLLLFLLPTLATLPSESCRFNGQHLHSSHCDAETAPLYFAKDGRLEESYSYWRASLLECPPTTPFGSLREPVSRMRQAGLAHMQGKKGRVGPILMSQPISPEHSGLSSSPVLWPSLKMWPRRMQAHRSCFSPPSLSPI